MSVEIEVKDKPDDQPPAENAVETAVNVAEQAHEQAKETLQVAAQIAAQMDEARKEGDNTERSLWEGFNEVLGVLSDINRKCDETLSRLDNLENMGVATLGAASEAAANADEGANLETAALAVETAAETVEVAAETVQEPQERATKKRRWI